MCLEDHLSDNVATYHPCSALQSEMSTFTQARSPIAIEMNADTDLLCRHVQLPFAVKTEGITERETADVTVNKAPLDG